MNGSKVDAQALHVNDVLDEPVHSFIASLDSYLGPNGNGEPLTWAVTIIPGSPDDPEPLSYEELIGVRTFAPDYVYVVINWKTAVDDDPRVVAVAAGYNIHDVWQNLQENLLANADFFHDQPSDKEGSALTMWGEIVAQLQWLRLTLSRRYNVELKIMHDLT